MRARRLWIAVVAVIALVGAVAVALGAQRGMGGQGMMGGRGGMMGGEGGMMGGGAMNCPMAGAMSGMMGRSAIAVSDGAVYVLAGSTLRKYGQNLDLQKEVEVTVSPAAMQQMQHMMQSCPMMGQATTPKGQAPRRGQAPPSAHRQHHP